MESEKLFRSRFDVDTDMLLLLKPLKLHTAFHYSFALKLSEAWPGVQNDDKLWQVKKKKVWLSKMNSPSRVS